jgi:hypothetical protein
LQLVEVTSCDDEGIETQKGNNYLRCTKKKGPCSQPFVREGDVSQQVSAAVSRVALPHDWIEWMQAELDSEIKVEHAAAEGDRKTVRHKLTENEHKQRRINTALAEGALELDEFREVNTTLVQEKTSLKEQLAAME